MSLRDNLVIQLFKNARFESHPNLSMLLSELEAVSLDPELSIQRELSHENQKTAGFMPLETSIETIEWLRSQQLIVEYTSINDVDAVITKIRW